MPGRYAGVEHTYKPGKEPNPPKTLLRKVRGTVLPPEPRIIHVGEFPIDSKLPRIIFSSKTKAPSPKAPSPKAPKTPVSRTSTNRTASSYIELEGPDETATYREFKAGGKTKSKKKTKTKTKSSSKRKSKPRVMNMLWNPN